MLWLTVTKAIIEPSTWAQVDQLPSQSVAHNVSRRIAFTQAEIAAVASQARAGVRLAMMVRPDGTKIIVPATDDFMAAATSDLDDRLAAFAASR